MVLYEMLEVEVILMVNELICSIETEKFQFLKKVFLNPEEYRFESLGDWYYIYRNIDG